MMTRDDEASRWKWVVLFSTATVIMASLARGLAGERGTECAELLERAPTGSAAETAALKCAHDVASTQQLCAILAAIGLAGAVVAAAIWARRHGGD